MGSYMMQGDIPKEPKLEEDQVIAKEPKLESDQVIANKPKLAKEQGNPK